MMNNGRRLFVDHFPEDHVNTSWPTKLEAWSCDPFQKRIELFTKEEMSEAEARGRKKGLEEAAKEADRLAGNDKDFGGYVRKAAGFIALAIRALDLADSDKIVNAESHEFCSKHGAIKRKRYCARCP